MIKISGVSILVLLWVIFGLSLVVAPSEEQFTLSECGDSEDNDGDGDIDYPKDDDCSSISDREQECIVDAACGLYRCNWGNMTAPDGDCFTSCTGDSQCRDDTGSTLICDTALEECVTDDGTAAVVCDSSTCGTYICDTSTDTCYASCTYSDAECAEGYVCDTDTSTCVTACDASSCGAYACAYDGEECETNCESDGNCAEGYYCISDGTCEEDADADGNPDICLENIDCSSGYVCDTAWDTGSYTCVEYCGVSETECSNGIDDDGDGDGYDYGGSCTIDSVVYPCSLLPDGSGGTVDYSGVRGSLEECESVCTTSGYIFTEGDPECRSPLDTDESSDPSCATEEDDDGDGDGGIFGVYGGDNVDDQCDYPEDKESDDISYAPEEQGFWASVVDFLIFWN